MTAEFTLSLHAYQAQHAHDPATGDFLDLRASVSCRGFAGQTAFWFARRDFDAFLADLVKVPAGAADSALLVGGWDDATDRLRLRIAPAGISGDFSAGVRIAATGPRTDQWQRVETEFVCAAAALEAFIGELRRFADREPCTATLVGDPEGIA